MSQQAREFIQSSGVEITPAQPNYSRTVDFDLGRNQQFPQRLERNIVNDSNYGQFDKYINDFNFEVNEETVKQVVSPVTISKFNPGMFNATVNRDFGTTPRIDIKKILMTVPLGRTFIGEDLYVETDDIQGIYGQFKTGFSHTTKYGPKGNLGLNFFTVQIKLKLTNGTETKGATVNIYRNGKIRFSGGFIGTNIENQPELLRRFIVNAYTDKQSFLMNPFEYNNLSGQFKINGNFKDMAGIARKAGDLEFSYVSYEPELSPMLYITHKGHRFNIASTGNIQILGSKNPTELNKGYNDGGELMQKLYFYNHITITGEFPKKASKSKVPKMRKIKAKTPVKKVVASRRRPQVFMIGAKKCESMKKPQLVDMAKKMGVVGITKSTTKEEICKEIEKRTNKKIITFKNTNKNKNVSLSGSNKTFKVDKSTCKNLKKGELLRFAKILKIPIENKDTKTSLCKKLEKARNELAKPKPKPKPKPKTPNNNSNNNNNNFAANLERSMIQQNALRKRGINDNSIRKDLTKLYGDKWMKRYKPSLNQDVRNIKKEMNSISKVNKKGVPFKKDVDAIKKRMVARWKMERKRELEKKYYMNTVNVTGVNARLKNDYRRAAAKYAMNQKTAPSKKKMENYKKSWLKFRANMNVNNARKKWNAVATAARGRSSFPTGTRVEKV